MYFNKCCIKNCTNRRKDARLHKFPCDDIRRSKWLEIIGCDELNSLDLWSISRKLVCHEHFETRFYTEKQWLHSTAYPTLFSAEEIASGVPSKSYGEEFLATDLDHCYSKRKHWDHSYVKSGPCVPDNLTKKRRKVLTEPACQKTQAPSKSQKKICDSDNLNETKFEGSEADDDFYTMDQDYIEDDFEVAINLNDEDKKNLEDDDVKYVREIVFEKDLTHPDYKCNVCSSEIVGFRYLCVQCVDWDMCASCEARGEHPEHYVLRLPAPKPYVECEPIIAAVREQIKNLTLLTVEIKPEVYLKEENDVDEITEDYDPNLTDPFTTTNDRNVPKLEKYESATEIESFSASGNQIDSFSASGKQFEYFDESGEEIETFSEYGEDIESFSKSGKEIESFSGSATKTETLRDLRNSTIIDAQSFNHLKHVVKDLTKSGGKKITVRVNAYSNSVNQCLEEIFKSVRNPNIDNKEPECSNSSPS